MALSPFVLNAIMGAAKMLMADTTSTAAKRGVLGIFAVIGAVLYSTYLGTPIDIDSITSLLNTSFIALTQFLLAHGSYTLFWKKQ